MYHHCAWWCFVNNKVHWISTWSREYEFRKLFWISNWALSTCCLSPPTYCIGFSTPIQCIIVVHDDAFSTTKCIEFLHNLGNMNSGSYSAFQTEVYQLVACHLPTIRIELYVVSLVFCHHPDTGGNFSEARVNSCKTESCSQSVSPTQFKTQARQCAIQKDVQNHRLVLHQSHSQVWKNQPCQLTTVSKPLETLLGKVVAAGHLLLVLEKGLHLLNVLISKSQKHWWIDKEFKV